MKHIIKRSLLVLLSAITMSGVTAVAPLTAGAAQQEYSVVGADYSNSEYNYQILGGEVSIKKYIGTASSVTIPSSLNGYPVTEILGLAFQKNLNITSVTFPGTLKKIGDNAFYGCSKLKSVNIPDNVTSLGTDVFYNCSQLSSVKIGKGITKIDSRTFYNCTSLKSLSFPSTLKEIGINAFTYCNALPSLTFPSSVTRICGDAFKHCSGLTSVSIPGNVKTIESGAFEFCKGIKTLSLGNGINEIGSTAFRECTGLTSVSIPNSVAKIGAYAFSNCTGLTNLQIGNSVSEIGNYLCVNCTSLQNVSIAEGTTMIGGADFEGCTALTSLSIPRSVVKIGNVSVNDKNYEESINICYGDQNCTIYGSNGSFAQAYAKANGIKFSTGTPAVKPAAPSLTLSNKSNGIRAEWNKASGAVKYKVYYKKNSDSKWSSAETSNNYYALLNLTAGTQYAVQVQSIGSNNLSGNYSAVKRLVYVPQVKPAVTLSNKSNGIRAEWKKIAGATKYTVYYKKDSDSKWNVAETGNTYYPLLKLSAGIKYAVQVQPVFNGSKGLYSAVNRLVYIPQVKPSVTLSNKSNGIRAEWSSVAGADKYIVYYKKDSDSKWNSTETANNYYPLLKLTAGTKYAVQVQPVFKSQKGLYSSVSRLIYKPTK